MTSNHWKRLCNACTEDYETLVQHEDYEDSLLPAL